MRRRDQRRTDSCRAGDRAAGGRRQLRQAQPAHLMRNPVMFVVEVGQRAHHDPVLHGPRLVDARTRTCSPGSSRCSSGSPCCSRTSPRRSPKGGARRRPTRCARPAPRRWRTAGAPTASIEEVPEHRSSTSATRCVVVAGEVIPSDGEVDRGDRQRRRVGDHRRVGAGDPRGRRRPLGGHRRHARAVRPRSSCASPPGRARRSSTG